MSPFLKDAEQRQQAIDPESSFIVQAPAGSGKTELLTQRFLRLLGTVQAPEQIVAITFTKKAANEMRARILAALYSASTSETATSTHHMQTLTYASQALDRNNTLQWNLLSEPNRLRIMTIDALCQRLAHAIPLQEDQLSFPEVSQTPDRHYLNAAKACLNFSIINESLQPALVTLLKHVDNRHDTLLELFTGLLAQRDQWLQPLYQAKLQQKETIEDALVYIEQHELARLRNSIPHEQWQTLMSLSQRISCIENNPTTPRHHLKDWNDIDELNTQQSCGLAALLLTSQYTLRKSFDHHVGLKKGTCEDMDYYDIKTKSQILLAQLEEHPDFLQALIRVKELPDPIYPPEQWKVLQALFTLLPLLVAHLNLSFSEHNEVDFTAVSQQALEALGDEENPTDLALYLDNAIQHLLIDEFQDTSIQQYQLLSKLVHGWQIGDGRTLFVVGDPMQSIYRFRAAEVGLFIRAQQEGIGSVQLTPLQLCCNFRSTQTIVQWINQQFQHIFPQAEDIESGAVSFHPSVHTRENHAHTHVIANAFDHVNDEADAIITIIRQELNAHPTDSVAILVRSRSQLSAILRRLREEQLPFQGIEIDLLADLPHLRDVWSFTQAMLMPANRLAWLSFLRSPWCGLSLSDLHLIATLDQHQSIFNALMQLDKITGLSDDGRIRCQFIISVLQSALAKRHQQPLVDWLIDTLNTLHLEHILDPRAQEDLEQYWLLLERFEQDGQLADLSEFYAQLKKLYSKQVTPSRLQIMTIHKSKGLEFDCVILPSLSKKQPAMHKPLLRWLTLPTPQHDDVLLISPIKAAHHERCLLYDYIGQIDAQKNDYEMQRLLYVAVTRAKKRLYLTDNQLTPHHASFRQLLQIEWSSNIRHEEDTDEKMKSLPTLYRLPLNLYQNRQIPSTTQLSASTLTLSDHTAKLIGIIMHEILQWICNHHPDEYDDLPTEFINHRLRASGLTDEHARHTLNEQLTRLFQCPKGCWIIQAHDQEHNEYELLIEQNNDIATRIIDRTFCDNGIRWIIDFKTGQMHPNAKNKHRQQLNEYADIMSRQSPEPIRCGLYYLTNNHWDEWAYDGPMNQLS